MLMKADSRILRILLVIANPTELLPPLIPLWVEEVCETYVRVSLRYR